MHSAKERLESWTLDRSTGGMILVWITLLVLLILMISTLGLLGAPALIFWTLPIAAGMISSGYLVQALDWREKAGAGTCDSRRADDG